MVWTDLGQSSICAGREQQQVVYLLLACSMSSELNQVSNCRIVAMTFLT
jgi:hypothetical protein